MLDLDDTTVLHGKKNLPSVRVTEAIKKAKLKIHVCIATARIMEDAFSIIDYLQLSGPCILMNGTQIYDPVKKKIIYEQPLDQLLVPEVLAMCQKHHLRGFLHDGTREFEYTGENLPKKVVGVYVSGIVPSRIDDIVKIFRQIPDVNIQKLPSWDKQYMGIHITHPNASKLHGILQVSHFLHIKTEQIIGVGDGYNDFPLLSACGLKIAMGNAVSELKAIADFIAPSVYEDGVATVLEKFVLTS